MAEKKFRLGKELCLEGRTDEGLKLIKEAVEWMPQKTEFRGHLAHWLHENCQFDEAKEEALMVLTKLNPSYLLAHQVYFNACVRTGDIAGMQDAIKRMKSCPGRVTKSRCKIEDSEKLLYILKDFCARLSDLEKTRNFFEILKICNQALKMAPYFKEILIKKAIALFGMKRYTESVEAFKDVPSYSSSFRLLDIMSKAEYLSLKFPAAMEYNQQAIDLLPESSSERQDLLKFRECLKVISKEITQVLVAMKDKDWQTMQERAANCKNLLTNGCFKNERLRLQMMNFEAGAFLQLEQLDEAYVLVNEVLSSWDTNYEALTLLADINISVGKYQDALKDLERLKSMRNGTHDLQLEKRILEAKTKEHELKCAKEPRFFNLYKLLDLPNGASESEIRRQYRNLSRLYHPDKTRHLSPAEQQKAKGELLRIQSAYGILSDADKKCNFDKGLSAFELRAKSSTKDILLVKLEENRKKYPKVFGINPSTDAKVPASSSTQPVTPVVVSGSSNRKRVHDSSPGGMNPPEIVKRYKEN